MSDEENVVSTPSEPEAVTPEKREQALALSAEIAASLATTPAEPEVKRARKARLPKVKVTEVPAVAAPEPVYDFFIGKDPETGRVYRGSPKTRPDVWEMKNCACVSQRHKHKSELALCGKRVYVQIAKPRSVCRDCEAMLANEHRVDVARAAAEAKAAEEAKAAKAAEAAAARAAKAAERKLAKAAK
jgi:hypothetical protein